MSPSIRKRIRVPIYDLDLWLVVAEDIYQAALLLPVELRCQAVPSDSNHRAIFYSESPYYAIVFDALELEPGIIGHEIGHAARQMMEDIGFTINSNNDEPLARLEDWITARVYKILPTPT